MKYRRIEQLQVCCDENTLCVPNGNNNSNENKMMTADTNNYNNNYVDSHKGKKCHSKNTEDKGLDIEYFKPDLNSKLKEELKKHEEEQLILLKENKHNIVNFIIHNRDSIRIEDLKIYEPVYKCYRDKGNCIFCNDLTNIVCINCINSHNNNKEVWLCTNHWQDHLLRKK